jgi:hypothetical protein
MLSSRDVYKLSQTFKLIKKKKNLLLAKLASQVSLGPSEVTPLQILYFILYLYFTTIALAFHVIAKDGFRISRIRKIIVRRVCNQK